MSNVLHNDRFVEGKGGIRLAVRDHGGSGTDLLLLHGAGSHLLSLFNLVRKFEDGFRVVTMDARWSGQSGDSETYRWGDLVGDVEAVVEQLGLNHPIVGGHSWGGMIAAHYGAAHAEARAVINLDGHGAGDPSLYDGVTPEEYERQVRAMQGADPATDIEHEGDAEWLSASRAEVRRMNEMLGVPAELLDEFTDRTFVEVAPGRWRRHPSPQLSAALRGDLDLFALYRRVECPLQIYNCSAHTPGLPDEINAFLAAYRRGLSRALAELAAARDGIDVVELPQFHHNGVLAGGAKVVAAEIRRFVAAVA